MTAIISSGHTLHANNKKTLNMACDYPSVDIDSIQNELDVNVRSLSEGWCGSIPFHCFVIDEDFVTPTIPTEFILSEIDLCEF